MSIRVVLADDHVLVRQSLRSFLEREGIQVVGEASDGQELIGVVSRLGPEVAVLDISMPLMNGLEAAGEIHRVSPDTKTILLTRHDEEQYVTEALRMGVKGYVLKNQAATDLVHAIHQVCRGGFYLSPGITAKTAESHRARLMHRLDIHETASPVRYAIRRGLIQP